MTTLGKILIFVNLAFSVVVGILIGMVFASRTNWKIAYDKLAATNKVNEALVRTYADEVKAAKKAGEETAKTLQNQIAQAANRQAALEKQLQDERAAAQIKVREAMLLSNNASVSTAELAQRRNEVTQLQQLLAQRDQQLIEEQTQKKELRDRFVRADIAARSAHNRTKELMDQVERLTQDNDRLKGGSALAGSGGRKPPDDVKGIIKEVDKSGLVTTSLGSDAGLGKGNVLQVYRLSPLPQYLGELRILDVNHHESVGRLTSSQRTAQLQPGDTVATRIMDAH